VPESDTYVSPFIEDGYTAEFTIPEIPGVSSPVFIRYRPLTAEDESIVRAKSRLNEDTPWVRLYAQLMVGDPLKGVPAKLLGWDIKDRQGNAVPVTVDNICRQKEAFFDNLFAAMKLGSEDEKNS
jgi:hypothetical protein